MGEFSVPKCPGSDVPVAHRVPLAVTGEGERRPRTSRIVARDRLQMDLVYMGNVLDALLRKAKRTVSLTAILAGVA